MRRALLVLLSLPACSPTSSPDTPTTDAASSAVAVAPARPSVTAPPVTTSVPVASATTSTPTALPASAAPPAAPASAAPATSAPAAEGPLPRVKVANIGIHIGGGPNDDATKEPFKKSVQPHYDEMRRCWAMVDGQKGDVSVELRVERDGGKARVRPNQTTFKSKEFNACLLGVFERIDFLKPRTGTTVLNFSLRFSPE